MTYVSNAAELLEHGARAARNAGYWFLPDAPSEIVSVPAFVPFVELAERAAEMSGSLAAQGLRAGDRLAFIIPQLDLAIGLLFACLRSGICPIPIREPLTAAELATYPASVERAITAHGARALIVTSRSEMLVREAPPSVPTFLLESRGDAGFVAPKPQIHADDCAIVQVSITGNGPAETRELTHVQLIDSLETSRAALGLREDDVFVSWLPPFEATGLTALLLPLYCQRSCALLPMRHFLKRPASWLETIDRVRGSISFAPADGYAFCGKRVTPDQLRKLDLGCWRVAGSVDAPVAHEVAGRVARCLSPAGFQAEAFTRPPAVLPNPGTRAERSEALALSHGQRALWFLAQIAPESTSYNVPVCIRISSKFDAALLRRAVTALVERHDVLRSVYPMGDGEPHRKLVAAGQALDFAQVDLPGLDEGAFTQRCLAEVERSFDLESGPLFVARLLVRTPSDAALLLVVPHINVDGSSIMQLGAELWAVYEAHARGVAVALPPLEHTYDDFVRWQAELLGSAEGARLHGYWSRQLAGAPRAINLRGDRARPVRRSERGGSIPVRISDATSTALRELARRHDTTLYTVLLAAFSALLHRESGDDDLLIATPAVGRSTAAFRGLIGYFVNTLPIRVRIARESSFQGLIPQLRATVTAALDHQDLPYSLIVEGAQPERGASHLPLCQVLFQLHGFRPDKQVEAITRTYASDARAKLGELTAKSVELLRPVSQFELALELNEFSHNIAGRLTYSADRFEPVTGQRLADEFVRLAGLLATDPFVEISHATRLAAPLHHVAGAPAPRPMTVGGDL